MADETADRRFDEAIERIDRGADLEAALKQGLGYRWSVVSPLEHADLADNLVLQRLAQEAEGAGGLALST